MVVQLKNDKFLITAALPYANSDLHIGHIASTYLPADILYKYLKMKDYEVIHMCASDDFGTPILISAEKQGQKAEDYVMFWNKRFKEDLSSLGIEYDIFDRTSSEENIRFVQDFFMRLYKKGYIYEKDIEQFYCEYDKKFLPDRYVKGKCPFCGAEDQYSDGCEVCGRVFEPTKIISPKCTICGREPIFKRSKHYFFKLSLFSSKLAEWLSNNANLQQDAVKYVNNWIKDGLQDWDITRDISWGVPIPLPEAEGKVLYGWFDNHLCYISATLKFANKLNDEGPSFWNSLKIYHFIGKDIVYHHYLFLPAMRMGHGLYKLPDFIPARGHLLLEGKKISKSRNWVITIRDFVSKYPADYLRYYLARIVPNNQSDCNFDWNDFKEKINNELVSNIGNFVYRTFSLTKNSFNSVVPEPSSVGEQETSLESNQKNKINEYVKEMEKLNFDRALRCVLQLSDLCNQYFQLKEPWKGRDSGTTIYYALNSVKKIALMLYPFVPFSSTEIWKALRLQKKKMKFSEIEVTIEPGHVIGEVKIIFSKV